MLAYGIIGASKGSFIADAHVRGIAATGKANLVAGCFSRDAGKNKDAGGAYRVAAERVYATAAEMAAREARRSDRIDFAVITTPNIYHYEIARMFLEAGINVASDKPVTTDEWQAMELQKLAESKGLKFCVTFTYAGYPALQNAASIIKRGDIGGIAMVMGEYAQDWLVRSDVVSPWRTDPEFTGRMNSIADIGSHVMYTVNWLTGLEISEVCAELDCVGGYKTDTNASVLLKYANGATGMYWSSQIAHGNDNGHRIRIYGAKGSIEWKNEDAERFTLTFKGCPPMTISKGHSYIPELPFDSAGRLPSGHHEGLYYSFANIYGPFIDDIEGRDGGYYPSIADGVRCMRWLEGCYQSNQKKAWVKL